jgi:hypothetical protein
MNALARQWHPGELLEVSGYFGKTCTLHAAVKLDVFSRSDEKQLTGPEVSNKLNAAPRGVEQLLNALAAIGLLARTDGTCSNISASLKFLPKNSPQYLDHIIMHHHHLVEPWSKLDQAVQSGQAYSEKQIMDMMADTGSRDIQRLSVQTPNDSGIITGIV